MHPHIPRFYIDYDIQNMTYAMFMEDGGGVRV
jgi:hypothetical protein